MSENNDVALGSVVNILGKGLSGTVSYVGATQFAAGKWIGITLDEKLGKNDGTVQGKRYFTCEPNQGVFVRPGQIQVTSKPPGTLLTKKSDSTSGFSSGLKKPKTGRLSMNPKQQGSLLVPQSRLPTSTKEPSQSPVLPAHSQDKEPEPAVTEPPKVQEAVIPEPTVTKVENYTSSALMSGISMVEIDSLKAQAKEWREKYDTIRIKRQDDRAKLKEAEKLKIQISQLNDTKTRLSEQVQDLSKKHRAAKQEAEEAIEAKEKYIEEMSDVHETIEMATLDKEMAEEKADMLQKEVENLTEQVEELQTDLDIMKEEIEQSGDGSASNYQVKQLEDQNSRLKEALVRMRDLSTAEKAEYANLEKILEQKKKEVKELQQKKDKLTAQLEEANVTMDELKEQVDAALPAVEMVEKLTDKNLDQEEKLMDMEEQIHDLETINEMNEELQENARENEFELREQVDLMRSKVVEANRRVEAVNSVVVDYETTLVKFRKLVQDLQDSNQELRLAHSSSNETSEADTIIQPPNLNYHIKMVETKSLAYSIEKDMIKLDVFQAKLQSKLLSMFMPNMFNRNGGDHDCVQTVLLVIRLSRKSDILVRHVREKFQTENKISKSDNLVGDYGDRLTFATTLINILTKFRVLLDKYSEAIDNCSVELLQKVGTLYTDMAQHERILDNLTDELQKDLMDENTNLEYLGKSLLFFQHLFTVHLSNESFNFSTVMTQHLDLTQAAVLSISTNTIRLKSFLQLGQETSDVAILLKDLDTYCTDIRQFCKKIKHQLPDTNSGKELKAKDDIRTRMQQSLEELFSVQNAVMTWTTKSAKNIGPTDDNKILVAKMQSILINSTKEVFHDTSPFQGIRVYMGNAMALMNKLLTSMKEGDFDATMLKQKLTPPIEKRANIVKSEIGSMDGFTSKIKEKDIAINELRKTLKLKSEDVSETKIKNGMLEKKLEKGNKESSEKLVLLQQKHDLLMEDNKRKEKEYDETLDALQADIDSLELEKMELKQRLAAQAKKNAVFSELGMKPSGLGSTLPGATSGISSFIGGTEGSPPVASVTDSPLLVEQIQALEIELRLKNSEYSQLIGEKMLNEIKSLTPLFIPKPDNSKKSESVRKLQKDLCKLHSEIEDYIIVPVIDISKRKPGRYPIGSRTPLAVLKNRKWKLQMLSNSVSDIGIKTQQVLAQDAIQII